jgi:WD40 repeat protein
LTSKSKLDITHEDYTFPLDSHPFLPLYVSGNRRGILSAWKFGQSEDKSLYQYMPEVDPRQADPKKACVKKIMFNSYGDKIMSNNIEGSFCIYQMDGHSKKSRKVPIFSLYENQDSKVSDFDLVNSDNILCTISSKQKTIKIYDTLLPYSYGKQGCVMEYKQQKSEAWGNIVLCNQRKQVIYTFNGRTGLMAELDLRMNLNMITQHQLSQSQEITAVCLNQANDTLITGYKDGHVKIHSTHQYYESNETRDMKLREKIEAFPFDFRSKKGLVQRIKINQKNGGLFASSQSGTLKLLRTKV